jgi:hypothetical protein
LKNQGGFDKSSYEISLLKPHCNALTFNQGVTGSSPVSATKDNLGGIAKSGAFFVYAII